MKFKNGPNNVAVGFTQASVSANNNPLPDVMATTAFALSESEAGSIIDKADDVAVLAVVATEDWGTTKADAPLIIVRATQQKTAVSLYIFIVDMK